MKKSPLFLLLCAIAMLFTSCTSNTNEEISEYSLITAQEAKEIIEKDQNVTILDVRTESEFLSGHITNAILLPYDQIRKQAETVLTDKNATILVYCRSGRRSAIAAKELSTLGYTQIYDFGGINDWPYDITIE